jgi:hypothetical protein
MKLIMAGEPSVVVDYLSIIVKAIETAQNDPAELRNLVYDVARLNLGKQILTRYREIGGAEFQRHILDLETAIGDAERLWRQEHQLQADRKDMRLLNAPDGSADHTAVAIRDQPDDAEVNDYFSVGGSIVVHDAPVDLYRETGALSEFFKRVEVWKPSFGSGGKRNRAALWPFMRLAIAMVFAIIAYVGVSMYSVLSMRIANSQRPDFPNLDKVFQSVSAASMSSNIDAGRLSARAMLARGNSIAPSLDFQLPTAYGIYAVSEGKLYDLSALPIKVPDSRIAISAVISTPSHVTLPNGKLTFIVFRRDQVSSAPDEVAVRVIARVVKDMKFNGALSPTISRVDDEWAIRSKSYELGVAPVGDNPEMIVIRPKDTQFLFSPGRYALVVKGQGYDFSVDGQLTDTAQCLERTKAVNGTIYSECRNLP